MKTNRERKLGRATMATKPRLGVALGLLALLFLGAEAPASRLVAQTSPAPAPTAPREGDAAEESGPASPKSEGAGGDVRPSVRARWKAMTSAERRQLLENLARWKRMTPDEREQARKRHDRLDEERRATDRLLPDDERRVLEKLPPSEHRRELTRRAKRGLKERFDRLAPETQERVRRALKRAGMRERADDVRRLVQREIPERIRAGLRRRVESGQLPREDVEALARRALDTATKVERARLLREFILAHPDAFGVTKEIATRLRAAGDPLFDLRLLEQLRRGRGIPGRAVPPWVGRPSTDPDQTPRKPGDRRI